MPEPLPTQIGYAIALAVSLTKYNAALAEKHAGQILKTLISRGVVEPEKHSPVVPPDLLAMIEVMTEDEESRQYMSVIAEAMDSWGFTPSTIMASLKPLIEPDAKVKAEPQEVE